MLCEDRVYYSSPHVIVLQPLCELGISIVKCIERVICQMLDKRRKLQKAFEKVLNSSTVITQAVSSEILIRRTFICSLTILNEYCVRLLFSYFFVALKVERFSSPNFTQYWWRRLMNIEIALKVLITCRQNSIKGINKIGIKTKKIFSVVSYDKKTFSHGLFN